MDDADLGDDDALRVEDVRQQTHRAPHHPGPLPQQPRRHRMPGRRRVDHVQRVAPVADARLTGPPAQGALAQLGLEAAGPAARAGLGAARQREMGDRARLGARPVVHLVMGGEGRVDDVPGEQVQRAPAAPRGPAEQPLRVRQRPRVPVHMDRQPGTGAQHLTRRDLPPAQQRMVDDRAGRTVDPAAGRETDAERPPFRHLLQQPGQTVRGPLQHPHRLGVRVRQPPFGHHPAAQVQQRHRRVRHRHMDPADHQPRPVHVEGQVRTSDPARAARRRGLTEQAEFRQPGAVVGHGGRRQTGEPRDRAARHRTALQHAPQHGAGAGAPPVGVGGTRRAGRGVGRGCHGTKHGELPRERVRHCAVVRESRRAGSAPSASSEETTGSGAHASQIDVATRGEVPGLGDHGPKLANGHARCPDRDRRARRHARARRPALVDPYSRSYAPPCRRHHVTSVTRVTSGEV